MIFWTCLRCGSSEGSCMNDLCDLCLAEAEREELRQQLEIDLEEQQEEEKCFDEGLCENRDDDLAEG